MAVLAAGAARFRFTLRPQVVAFLLFSAYLFLLERWRHGGERGVWALAPLQVLWANVHGSAVLGFGLAFGFAVGESLRALLARRLGGVVPRPRDRVALGLLWPLAGGLLALTLVNPHGARLLTLPFTHAAAQETSGLKELLKDRAGIALAQLGGEHVLFGVLAAVGLATLAASVLRKDVTEVGLFVGLLVLALRSERFVGLFAVASVPIVARNLTSLAKPCVGLVPRRTATAVAASALLALGGLGFVQTRRAMPFGLGVPDGLLPEEEVAFVEAEYPEGKLFNDFEHGGYIAWRTRRPVFLDSRGVLAYPPDLMVRYVGLWTSREPRLGWLDDYGVSVALVGRRQVAPGRREPRDLFRADPRWALVHEGRVADVFVRRPD
jgi:hypothetical protein